MGAGTYFDRDSVPNIIFSHNDTTTQRITPLIISSLCRCVVVSLCEINLLTILPSYSQGLYQGTTISSTFITPCYQLQDTLLTFYFPFSPAWAKLASSGEGALGHQCQAQRHSAFELLPNNQWSPFVIAHYNDFGVG